MEEKNLLGELIDQCKKTNELLAACDWVYDFCNGHVVIGASGLCLFIRAGNFHNMFEEYNVTPADTFDYHWAVRDGVTFYCTFEEDKDDGDELYSRW